MPRNMPERPLCATVLLVFRDRHGDIFVPGDVYFNTHSSASTPIDRAIDAFTQLPHPVNCGAHSWTFERAILVDPTLFVCRDVTEAFVEALRWAAKEEYHRVGCLSGWEFAADQIAQEWSWAPIARPDEWDAREEAADNDRRHRLAMGV